MFDAGDFALESIDFERVFNRHIQALGAYRFNDKVDSTGAHGIDSRVDTAIGCLDDYRWCAGAIGKPLQNFLTAEAGHDQIEQDKRYISVVGLL